MIRKIFSQEWADSEYDMHSLDASRLEAFDARAVASIDLLMNDPVARRDASAERGRLQQRFDSSTAGLGYASLACARKKVGQILIGKVSNNFKIPA